MKKQIKKYTQDALRTESLVDTITLNPAFLLSIITMATAAGNMLDQVKKHAFYDKDYDSDKLIEDFQLVVAGLEGVKHSFNSLDDEVDLKVDPRVFHSILGIATESTELLEALDINGEKMDNVNLLEESFDIDWYQFILLDALGGDLEEVWDTGIAKLRKRYPEKFTNEDAINRDLDAERNILDTLDRNPIDSEDLP